MRRFDIIGVLKICFSHHSITPSLQSCLEIVIQNTNKLRLIGNKSMSILDKTNSCYHFLLKLNALILKKIQFLQDKHIRKCA